MKHGKFLMWALILVPASVGGYLIFRYLKGGGKSDSNKKIDVPPNSPPIQPVKSSNASDFPLKSGKPYSDLVKQLQELLNVTADGLFGPKTQAALLVQTGKTSIASQSEFDAVISQLSAKRLADAAQAATSAKGVKSQSLIDAAKNNPQLAIKVLKPVIASRYTLDYNKVMHADGTSTRLNPGNMLTQLTTKFIGVGGTGNIRAQSVSNSAAEFALRNVPNAVILPDGYYLFDPDTITLV